MNGWDAGTDGRARAATDSRDAGWDGTAAGGRSRATAAPATDVVVRVEGVSRTFGRGEHAVHAVRDVSFTAARGNCSPSGAGPAPARPPC